MASFSLLCDSTQKASDQTVDQREHGSCENKTITSDELTNLYGTPTTEKMQIS